MQGSFKIISFQYKIVQTINTNYKHYSAVIGMNLSTKLVLYTKMKTSTSQNISNFGLFQNSVGLNIKFKNISKEVF